MVLRFVNARPWIPVPNPVLLSVQLLLIVASAAPITRGVVFATDAELKALFVSSFAAVSYPTALPTRDEELSAITIMTTVAPPMKGKSSSSPAASVCAPGKRSKTMDSQVHRGRKMVATMIRDGIAVDAQTPKTVLCAARHSSAMIGKRQMIGAYASEGNVTAALKTDGTSSSKMRTDNLPPRIYRKPFVNVSHQSLKIPKGEDPVEIYRKPFVNYPPLLGKPENQHGKRSADADDELGFDLSKRRNYYTRDRRFTLLNATPYVWKRGYLSQYQMSDWNRDMWPAFIQPGEAISTISKAREGYYRGDTGAEVVYHLLGTSQPMSFQVEYNPARKKVSEVVVAFKQKLHTRHSPIGTRINLGSRVMHGGTQFLLAGYEGELECNDTPVQWMQTQRHEVGHIALNQLVMPRSHHAGMYLETESLCASPAQTVTQRLDIFGQLVDGSRILDFRPLKLQRDPRGKTRGFAEAHFSGAQGGTMGSVGAKLQTIIAQINDFNQKHPGEFVMIDIHDMYNWDQGSYYDKLDENDRAELYEELKNLNHRYNGTGHIGGLHWLPLNAYIGNGQSAVIVHCPDPWRKDQAFPGEAAGFTTNLRFPRINAWSNTESPLTLSSTQRAWLAQSKPHDTRIYDMQWLTSLAGAQNFGPKLGLKPRSKITWGRMYKGIWKACAPSRGGLKARVPNWITVDGFDGTGELRHLVTTMNKCLVAGRCGELQGLWGMRNGPSERELKKAIIRQGKDEDVNEFDARWEPWDACI